MRLHLHSGGAAGPRSALDITPLVDVALVLLVIFMVVTPLTMRSLPLSIPGVSRDGPATSQHSATVHVGPTGALELAVGVSREPIAPADLAPRLRALSDPLVEWVVFVDFHAELPYGRAVAVADTVRSAGFERVHLVTERRGSGRR